MVWLCDGDVMWCVDVMWSHITRPHHITITSSEHVSHQTMSHHQATVTWPGDVMVM